MGVFHPKKAEACRSEQQRRCWLCMSALGHISTYNDYNSLHYVQRYQFFYANVYTQWTSLTKVPIALQELLHIRPVLHRIHQLHQPWIFLQPLAPVLNQLFVVANLIYNQVCICDLLTDDKGASDGELVGREVLLQSLEEGYTGALLMFRINLVFVWAEERCNEKCPP